MMAQFNKSIKKDLYLREKLALVDLLKKIDKFSSLVEYQAYKPSILPFC